MSDYLNSLPEPDKKNYIEKLKLKNGNSLSDPYTLTDGWSDDISKLPNVTMNAIETYLIHIPSQHTHEKRKATKSLEGLTFFREGHVREPLYHDAADNFCFIKSKVNKSFEVAAVPTMRINRDFDNTFKVILSY